MSIGTGTVGLSSAKWVVWTLAFITLNLVSLGEAAISWTQFMSLPTGQARSDAQSVSLSHYVFVIGGKTGNENISMYEPIFWQTLTHQYDLEVAGLIGKDLVTPISGKTFVQPVVDSFYISYAASHLDVGVKFLRIKFAELFRGGMETGVEGVVDTLEASTIPRKRAVLAQFITNLKIPPYDNISIVDSLPQFNRSFFIIGGVDSVGKPVSEVEEYSVVSGKWAIRKRVVAPTELCDCAATTDTVHERIVFSGCVSCVTGAIMRQRMLFYPKSGEFVRIPMHHKMHFPVTSPELLTENILTIFYKTPDMKVPFIALFNLFQNSTTVLECHADEFTNRRNCAAFVFGSSVYCIGGVGVDGKRTSIGEQAVVIPAPDASFNKVIPTYNVGENIDVYSGETCQPSTQMRYGLFFDQLCNYPVPSVNYATCAEPTSVFRTSQLKLEPGQQIDFFMCYSSGTSPNLRNRSSLVPCASPSRNFSEECIWSYCYYEDATGDCWAMDPISEHTGIYSWTLQSKYAIFFVDPAAPETPPYVAPWYKTPAAIAAIAIGTFLLFVILWMILRKSDGKGREGREINSPVGVFGKNYILRHEIGSGSFGTVYLAIRTADDKEVALKVIPCHTRRQRDMAMGEYDVMKTVSHPNIISYHELILSWGNAGCSGNLQDQHAGSPTTLGSNHAPLSDNAQPLMQPHQLSPVRRNSDAYGAFDDNVQLAGDKNKGHDDDDGFASLAALKRFICIISDYYPQGDLRKFVLNYGKSCKSATTVGTINSHPVGALRSQQGDRVSEKSLRSTIGHNSSITINSETAVGDVLFIPEELITHYVIQVFSALVFLHNRSEPIVHRDLKPENVLLDGLRAVVTDFGLAAVHTDEAVSSQAGTLFCAAPEVFNRVYGPPVDVWAGGCLIYSMCTRKVSLDDAKVMFAHVDDDEFEEEIRQDLQAYSRELQDIVLACLQKDPGDRCNAMEVLTALSNLSKSLPIPAL